MESKQNLRLCLVTEEASEITHIHAACVISDQSVSGGMGRIYNVWCSIQFTRNLPAFYWKKRRVKEQEQTGRIDKLKGRAELICVFLLWKFCNCKTQKMKQSWSSRMISELSIICTNRAATGVRGKHFNNLCKDDTVTCLQTTALIQRTCIHILKQSCFTTNASFRLSVTRQLMCTALPSSVCEGELRRQRWD